VKYDVHRIAVVRVLNGIDILRKTGKTLIRGSHKPQHGVTNVKSLVANDETGLKVLTLKDLLESSKVSRCQKGNVTRNSSNRKKNGKPVTAFGRQGLVAV
jgi:hypothetical protein